MGQAASREADYHLLEEEEDSASLTRPLVYHQTYRNSVGLPILIYGSPKCGKSVLINDLTNELKSCYAETANETRCHVIPTEIRTNVDRTLRDNEYRFTALCYMVNVSLYGEGTKDNNPIMHTFKEIQKLANHNRMRDMPIVVMLTRKDLLAEELNKTPVTVNFPDYHGNNNPNEVLNFFAQKLKAIRHTTYRSRYYRSFYVFMPDSMLAMTLFALFYDDHIVQRLFSIGFA